MNTNAIKAVVCVGLFVLVSLSPWSKPGAQLDRASTVAQFAMSNR